VLAAGLVVVSVLGYRVLSRNRAALAQSEAANSLAEPAAPSNPTTAEPAAASSSEVAAPAPLASAVGADTSGSPTETAPVPAASAVEPSPAVSAAPSAADGEIRRVTVKSRPPKVRFFHFGKQVGVTPFVLELKPGERHAYEAGLPGYNTRKVVIDGSKPQIMVGLTREKP
jgi:hypothetical protein